MPGIQRVKYQTANDSIFNVLLDDNTGVDTLIGTPPAGEYTENMTIRVSKNNKEVGIRPRQVLLTCGDVAALARTRPSDRPHRARRQRRPGSRVHRPQRPLLPEPVDADGQVHAASGRGRGAFFDGHGDGPQRHRFRDADLRLCRVAGSSGRRRWFAGFTSRASPRRRQSRHRRQRHH